MQSSSLRSSAFIVPRARRDSRALRAGGRCGGFLRLVPMLSLAVMALAVLLLTGRTAIQQGWMNAFWAGSVESQLAELGVRARIVDVSLEGWDPVIVVDDVEWTPDPDLIELLADLEVLGPNAADLSLELRQVAVRIDTLASLRARRWTIAALRLDAVNGAIDTGLDAAAVVELLRQGETGDWRELPPQVADALESLRTRLPARLLLEGLELNVGFRSRRGVEWAKLSVASLRLARQGQGQSEAAGAGLRLDADARISRPAPPWSPADQVASPFRPDADAHAIGLLLSGQIDPGSRLRLRLDVDIADAGSLVAGMVDELGEARPRRATPRDPAVGEDDQGSGDAVALLGSTLTDAPGANDRTGWKATLWARWDDGVLNRLQGRTRLGLATNAFEGAESARRGWMHAFRLVPGNVADVEFFQRLEVRGLTPGAGHLLIERSGARTSRIELGDVDLALGARGGRWAQAALGLHSYVVANATESAQLGGASEPTWLRTLNAFLNGRPVGTIEHAGWEATATGTESARPRPLLLPQQAITESRVSASQSDADAEATPPSDVPSSEVAMRARFEEFLSRVAAFDGHAWLRAQDIGGSIDMPELGDRASEDGILGATLGRSDARVQRAGPALEGLRIDVQMLGPRGLIPATVAGEIDIRDGGFAWPSIWNDPWILERAAVHFTGTLDPPSPSPSPLELESELELERTSGSVLESATGSTPKSEERRPAEVEGVRSPSRWSLALESLHFETPDLRVSGAARAFGGAGAPPFAGDVVPDMAGAGGEALPEGAPTPLPTGASPVNSVVDAEPLEPGSQAAPFGWWDGELSIEHVDVAALGRYLPSAMPTRTAAWLRQALRAGEIAGGSIAWRGDPTGYPRHAAVDAQGEPLGLRAELPLRGVTLAYRPGWPPLADISGLMQFDGERFTIHDANGWIDDVRAAAVAVKIDDMLAAHPLLEIDGQLIGPAETVMNALETSGTRERIGLDEIGLGVEGALDGRLRLAIPLSKPDRRGDDPSVRVDADLERGRVSLDAVNLVFDDVRARFAVLEDGAVEIESGRGRLFGEPIEFASPPDADRTRAGQTRLRFEGRQRLADWRARLPEVAWPWFSGAFREADFVSKPRDVRVSLAFPFALDDGAERPWGLSARVAVSAEELSLPIEFPDAPIEPVAVRWAAAGTPSKSSRTLVPDALDVDSVPAELRVDIPEVIGAHLRLDAAPQEAPRLSGARAWLGSDPRVGPRRPPEAGVLQVDTASIDVVPWARWFNAVGPDAVGDPRPAGADAPTTLQRIRLRVRDDLRVGNQSLGELVLDARRVDAPDASSGNTAPWRIALDGAGLAGSLEWNTPRDDEPAALRGRLARLQIRTGDFDAGAETSDTASGLAVRLPDVAVTIDALRFGDVRVEAVELAGGEPRSNVTRQQAPPDFLDRGGRLWRLERLRARLPGGDVEMLADGWTSQVDGRWRSDARVRLLGTDWGGGLTDARLGEALSRGNGEGVLRARWNAPPWNPQVASLSGAFELDLRDGVIRQIDPGAGRLLGLVSLDVLSRRLRLDFRDVFDEGYAFGSLYASGAIEQGQLEIDSVNVVGPSAAVRVSGRVDLVSGALDQRVAVVPSLRTGIPLVGALLGGPVGAIAALVAERALNIGGLIEEAARLEYRVSGTISAPQVDILRSDLQDEAIGSN